MKQLCHLSLLLQFFEVLFHGASYAIQNLKCISLQSKPRTMVKVFCRIVQGTMEK